MYKMTTKQTMKWLSKIHMKMTMKPIMKLSLKIPMKLQAAPELDWAFPKDS